MVATAESKPKFPSRCSLLLLLSHSHPLRSPALSRHWQDEVHHGGMAYDFGTRRVDVNLNDKADALKDLEDVRLVVFFFGGGGGIVQ